MLYKRHPHTAGRVIDGLASIVTGDTKRMFTLNSTATALWELSADPISVEEVATELSRKYRVDHDTAIQDVQLCVNDLVERKILVLAN